MSRRRMKSNPLEPGVSFGIGLLVGLGAGLGIYYLATTKKAVVVEAQLPKVAQVPASGAPAA